MRVVAGSVSLVALAAVVASLGYLHLAPSGLSPVRNAVSQYGITRFRSGYRAATIAFGLSALALALAIGEGGRRSGGTGTVVALLVVFALARLSISWFPMDSPGSQRTETGRRHGLLAMAAFASATAAAFALGRSWSGVASGRFGSFAGVSSGLGAAMLASLFAMAMARSSPGLRERFGLVERCFYLVAIAWFAFVAVVLVTR